MAAIYLDEGLPGTLKNKWSQTGGLLAAKVGLYTAISPALSKTSVIANLTPMSGLGYTIKTIANGDFAFALDSTNHWETATAVYTWTFSAGAGATIIGYYVTDTSSTKLFIAEQFGTPVTILAAGGSLQLTIVDKYQDCV